MRNIRKETVFCINRKVRVIQGVSQHFLMLLLLPLFLVHLPVANDNLHLPRLAHVHHAQLQIFNFPVLNHTIIDIIRFILCYMLPDKPWLCHPADHLPVFRINPGVDIFRNIFNKALNLKHFAKKRLHARTQAVRRCLVRFQIRVKDRFIIYAQPFNNLQPPQLFPPHQRALLVKCLHQAFQLLFALPFFLLENFLFGNQTVPFFRRIAQKNIEDAADCIALDKMPIILYPAYLSVLPRDPIFHVIQIILVFTDLLPYAFFHAFQIIGVNHPLEAVPCQLSKFRYSITLENAQQAQIRVNNLLIPLRMINEETARNLVHKLHNFIYHPNIPRIACIQLRRLASAFQELVDLNMIDLKEVEQR